MPKKSVIRTTSARIPTEYGEFHLCYYTNTEDEKAHLALFMGEIAGGENILVRVHSECFTGDVLGSQRCDCGEQLARSLEMIADAGCGILVYMRQEGRGIGLLKKIEAYNLQDAGHDTVDANLLLGHLADERDYTLAARILEDLGIKSIRLMTNNPTKIDALIKEGILVNERVELETTVTPENARYLHTKAKRMNHMLSLKKSSNVIPISDQHEPQPTD
jgi:3,4-dihydroxy 2-butanone 4-phosphate synthase / GTP cyclohydrolase II